MPSLLQIIINHDSDQWHSQTFYDGRAHYFDKILSKVIYKHASSYIHLLKGVVCMKMYSNIIVKAWMV